MRTEDNDYPDKNTIKAGGSTATKMWTGWMDGWMGDTPQTVTTTRPPCSANKNTIFLQYVQSTPTNCVLGGEADQGGEVPPLADLRPSQPVQVLSRKEINHFLSPFDLS